MNKSSEDLYKILELSKNATAEELKSSYRKLSIKWHPDKNPSNREKATEMFQKIANAYNILNDPDKKEIYDKHGQEGLDMFEKGMDPRKGGFGGAFGGPFGNFPFNFPNGGNPFGFPGAGGPGGPGGPNRQRQITKCGPTVFRLRLSLKELYQGGLYKLRYSYKEGCDPCEGTGSSTKKLETCNDCKGRGAKMLRRQLPNGMIQMMEQPCNTCLGKGQIADSKNICSICQGKTFIEKPKETDFTVYPGMQWKMQIGVEGQGDELRDQIPGDLVVLILPPKTLNDDPTGSESDDEDSNEGEEGEDDQTGSAQTWNKVNANTSNSTDASVNAAEVANTEADDNRTFDNVRIMSKPKRNNGDLIYKFSIPLVDALTGLKYKFVHPGSGDILVIDHPEVIKSGSVYIIPNKGMPNVDQAAIAHRVPLDKMNVTYGRIIIEFDVIFPTKIAKKTAEVLQALLGKGLSDADPNANLGGKVNKPLPNNGKGGKGKGKGLNAATVAATTVSNTGQTSPTNLPKPRYVPVNLILHQEEPDRDDEDMEQMGNSGPRMMHAPQCAQQ